ncbi:hypothetical protein ABT009_30905 [Streptomyces sp. NPDC002896]|uniref:hypothetical protein n=1 Tax=Streptomyces sp. NPDC002896 TaxID=3154438 RepID=UPI00332CD240
MTSPVRTSKPRDPQWPNSPGGSVEVRFLRSDDVEWLMALEQTKWNQEQAADGDELAARIEAYPQLGIGAFALDTGEALASLFMKPITPERLRAAKTWADCARVERPVPAETRSLFGISLSSIDADAVTAIFEFFWPYALKSGWRDIYLGSPMPGLRAWKRAHSDVPVDAYLHEKRHNLPRDPQLRYYYNKGFKSIEACKPDYFPHESSLDHGAILRGHIPLSAGAPLWRILPLSWLRLMRRLLFVLV